jgi:signal peptidase I
MIVTIIGFLVVILVQAPLVLWGAAKVLRIREARFWRACVVAGISLAAKIVLLPLGLLVPPSARSGLIVLVFLGDLCLAVALVRWIFRTTLRRAIGCWFLAGVASLAPAFLVQATVADGFYVPTGSMSPTAMAGERILVDKLAPRYRPLQRGDVVMFRSAANRGEIYLKRLIGIEGDRLEVLDGNLFVNGAPGGPCAVHPGLPQYEKTMLRFPCTVPPGKLFLLGDYRDRSVDSRYWGFEDARAVIGIGGVVYFSRELLDDTGFLGREPNFGRVRWERFGKTIK